MNIHDIEKDGANILKLEPNTFSRECNHNEPIELEALTVAQEFIAKNGKGKEWDFIQNWLEKEKNGKYGLRSTSWIGEKLTNVNLSERNYKGLFAKFINKGIVYFAKCLENGEIFSVDLEFITKQSHYNFNRNYIISSPKSLDELNERAVKEITQSKKTVMKEYYKQIKKIKKDYTIVLKMHNDALKGNKDE